MGTEIPTFNNKEQDFMALAMFIPVPKHYTTKVNGESGINTVFTSELNRSAWSATFKSESTDTSDREAGWHQPT
jgi:hypothetical protein